MSKYNFLTCMLLIAVKLLLIECLSPQIDESDQNLYNKLCYDPTDMTSKSFTLEQFGSDSPKDGWFVPLGNSAGKFHFGSLMKGKRLTDEDNNEDMCFTIGKAYTSKGTTGIGTFNGFGKQRAAIWNCKPSIDFPGVYRCNHHSAKPSKYRDRLYFYFVDTESEDVYVAINCFANGEIGWLALSTNALLTIKEYQSVINQVKSLGFPTTNISNTDFVKMFEKSCNTTRKIDKECKTEN